MSVDYIDENIDYKISNIDTNIKYAQGALPPYYDSNLYVWYDFADPDQATIIPATRKMTQFQDKGQKSMHMAQSTAIEQPLYSLNIQNGYPALVNDNYTNDQHLENSNADISDLSHDFSMYVVGKGTISGHVGFETALWGFDSYQKSGIRIGVKNGANPFWAVDFMFNGGKTDLNGSSNSFVNDELFVLCIRHDETNDVAQVWKNGVKLGEINSLNFDTVTDDINCQVPRYGGNDAWDGWVGEALLYESADIDIMDKICEYLNKKWKVY